MGGQRMHHMEIEPGKLTLGQMRTIHSGPVHLGAVTPMSRAHRKIRCNGPGGD